MSVQTTPATESRVEAIRFSNREAPTVRAARPNAPVGESALDLHRKFVTNAHVSYVYQYTAAVDNAQAKDILYGHNFVTRLLVPL